MTKYRLPNFSIQISLLWSLPKQRGDCTSSVQTAYLGNYLCNVKTKQKEKAKYYWCTKVVIL